MRDRPGIHQRQLQTELHTEGSAHRSVESDRWRSEALHRSASAVQAIRLSRMRSADRERDRGGGRAGVTRRGDRRKGKVMTSQKSTSKRTQVVESLDRRTFLSRISAGGAMV